VQITRGVAPRAHVFSSGIKSSLIISVKPHIYAKEIAVLKGEKAIVLLDQRWANQQIFLL